MSASMRRFPIPLVLIVMVVSMLLPAQQAAAVTVSQTVTSTSTQFAAGKFGLTGLAQNGGVQLVPLGQLKRWQTSPGTMCRPAAFTGTAVFGPYLYSIGGITTGPSIIREVCRNKVLNTDADLQGWQKVATEELPANRYFLSAAAVPRPGNPSLGYLYAIGGQSALSTQQSDLIYRTSINADGSVTPWTTNAAKLPTPRSEMATTSFTNGAGKSFIYVMGGMSVPFNTEVYSDIVRYEVQNDGSLLPSATPMAPLPLPILNEDPSCQRFVGLRQAAATTFTSSGIGSSPEKRFIVVMGGVLELGLGNASGNCEAVSQASARVFVGEINETTGNITWRTGVDQDYTMPAPIAFSKIVGINGKMYAVGGLLGSSQDSATQIAYSSYLEMNTFDLPSYGVGEDASNFLASPNTLNVNQRRAGHGLEIVTVDDRPMAFLFGGTNPDNGTYRSDTLYGYIGRNDDFDENTGGYSSLGAYTSPIYNLRGPGRLTEMRWTASISTTAPITTDIKLFYRMGESISELSGKQFVPVDGNPSPAFNSSNGPNIATSTDPTIGRFFQYQAALTTSAPDVRSATPLLAGPVSIRYVIEGHPSLYVDPTSDISDVVPGVAPVPTIKIVNALRPGTNVTETVLDADIEGNGTFFVDLYVFPPGTTPVKPMPNADGEYPLTSAAYAEVGKATMTVDKAYTIPAGNWKQTCPTLPGCPAVQWQKVFNKVGEWTVWVVVDSGDNVNESDTETGSWEADNNLVSFKVVSSVSGATIFMPVIYKGPLTNR
ncbi:MAG TPA: hypothetical protein VD886_07295 [Herpetosiphonaceae bacterium]|nr:hypothetical protein [Herpetosiphonaceae bacterium]